MKKIICLLLSIVMSTQLCGYGFALETQDTSDRAESLFGYTFTEQQLSTGEYVIESYYEGQPNKRYIIADESPVIHVQCISPKLKQGDYTIEKPNIVREYLMTRAERWASLGYIYYSDTTTDYPGPVRAYIMAYGNSRVTTCPVSVEAQTPFDDVVSFLTSFIIAEGFAKYAAIAGFTVTGWAGALLASIVGTVGAQVINGIIIDAFTDKVDSYVTDWDFKGTPFTETDMGDTVYLREQGSTCLMRYSDNIDWDEVETDITISNWKEHKSFARNMWAKMYPNTPYPGVEKYASQ